MNYLKTVKNRFLYSLLSIFLSYFFIYQIPWHDIKYFHDFEVYKFRVAELFSSGYNEEFYGVFILFSELLWTNILQLLPLYFYDINAGITFISFVTLCIYIYFTITRVNFVIAFPLLFNPIFIDLIISQVRIGVSFSLLLVAYSLKRTVIIPVILIICATLIHTATLLLLSIFIALNYLKNFFQDEKMYFKIALIFPMFIMFFIQVALLTIFDFFGDTERSVYITNPVYSSIFFTIPWFFFSFMIAILPKNSSIDDNIDFVAYAICMGSLFLFSSLFEFYGSRFVAVSFPLYIVSINCLSNQFRYPMFVILFLYQLTYFSYWL